MVKLLISLALLVISAFFNIRLYIEYKQSAELLRKCEDKYQKMLSSTYKNAEKVEQARVKALIQLHRADHQLLTEPAIEGDDCGSARIRIDKWVKERNEQRQNLDNR